MKALRCKDNGLSPFAHLINDVSFFFPVCFQNFHTHNKVTHILARLALTSPSCTVWMKDVPYRTLPFVQANLAAL